LTPTFLKRDKKSKKDSKTKEEGFKEKGFANEVFSPHESENRNNYPSYMIRTMDALQACSENPNNREEGVSRSEIYQWIGEHYPGTSVQSVRKALNEAVAKDLVSKPSDQRFKLTPTFLKPRSETKNQKKTPRRKKVSKKKASPAIQANTYQAGKQTQEMERWKAWSKIKVGETDIKLIEDEFELEDKIAKRVLQMHDGDLQKSIEFLLHTPEVISHRDFMNWSPLDLLNPYSSHSPAQSSSMVLEYKRHMWNLVRSFLTFEEIFASRRVNHDWHRVSELDLEILKA